MALSILLDGSIEVGNSLQGDAELRDEGLDQESINESRT
jgi:hypothetical protein